MRARANSTASVLPPKPRILFLAGMICRQRNATQEEMKSSRWARVLEWSRPEEKGNCQRVIVNSPGDRAFYFQVLPGPRGPDRLQCIPPGNLRVHGRPSPCGKSRGASARKTTIGTPLEHHRNFTGTPSGRNSLNARDGSPGTPQFLELISSL
jgi:hypothetical protein